MKVRVFDGILPLRSVRLDRAGRVRANMGNGSRQVLLGGEFGLRQY